MELIRMYDTNEDVLVARNNAMVNFNMIDIVGRGIRKIFNQQWERRFPMTDYEIDAAKKEVAVRLYSNAINEKGNTPSSVSTYVMSLTYISLGRDGTTSFIRFSYLW